MFFFPSDSIIDSRKINFIGKGEKAMVKLLVGHKGTGKTKLMVEMANRDVNEKNGSVGIYQQR